MKKLKVAVLNTQPPHLYFGGVERRIIEISKRLVETIKTEVYCGTKKGFKKTIEIDGITIIPNFSTDIAYPLDNWVFNQTLSRKVERIKPDIFEAHTVSGYNLLKKIKKCKKKKPFIQTIHGVLADEYYQSLKNASLSFRMKLSNTFMSYLGKLEKEAAQEATLIVTVSNYSSKKIVQLYGVDKKKIRIVPNGVDLQRFSPSEEGQKFKFCSDSKNLVLFVGNLIPRKGLNFLIEAAKLVIKEIKDTMFVIVGNGPLKRDLVSYSKELKVAENFIFLEDIDDNILPKLYNCADLIALPSIQEGQGISLLEGQASGKPVVAFNISAVNEVVKNKKTGILVKIDSQELGEAILHLLSDVSLREKMGSSGRKFVSENFSWDICAQKMLKVYSEVMN